MAEADQLEHNATLLEAADAADEAFAALSERTAALEAGVTAAVSAEREADDNARKARARRASAKAAEDRADARNHLEASEDAAARSAKAQSNVEKAQRDLATARQARTAAEEKLERHRLEVSGAAARCREATTAAMHPGIAPRSSPLKLGLGRPEDMTDSEKQMIAGVAILAHGLAAGTPEIPAGPDRQNRLTTRGEFASQDAGKVRMVRRGSHAIAVTPDWRGTGG